MTADTPDSPENDTPGIEPSENATPKNGASGNAAPEGDVPENEASGNDAPGIEPLENVTPKSGASVDAAPEGDASGNAAAESGTSKNDAPGSDTPGNEPSEDETAENDASPAVPELPPHLAEIADALGPDVEVVEQFGRIRATVPAERWVEALTAARDGLGADFLDWLTGVDELEAGYLVAAFVVATADRGPGRLGKARGLILRTRVAKDAEQRAKLASATGVYRGAAWHERETFEMFGIDFIGHEGLKPLLLPDGFEGHPLRKDFVLAARVAKAWPGAKEPGESDHHVASASPGRRRMLPPGVPGDEWLKPYRAPETGNAAGAAAEGDEGAAE